MDTRVPRWVRIGVAGALAVPQLVIGVWAIVAPRAWFDDFPGLGPSLVAAEPPYNGHLAVDVGAGFFATGVGLLLAAVWARRGSLTTALAVYIAFGLPHFLWHATHPSEALSSAANLANALTLASGLALACVFAWGAWRRPSAPMSAQSNVNDPMTGLAASSTWSNVSASP